MSFAELFSRDLEEQEPPQPPVEHERPVWLGPPSGELPVPVALGLVLGRSERGVVAVSHALAYSSGVSFDVVAHVGGLKPSQVQSVFHEQHGGGFGAEEPPAGFLRFGVELPDGTRLSNLARRLWAGPDEGPRGPVLFQSGGGGGQSSGTGVSWSLGFWLWPLPAEGLLRLFCEWPVAGIELAVGEIGTSPLLAASSGALQLWPGGDGGWTVGATSSSAQYVTASAPEPRADDGEDTVAVPAADLRAVEDALRSALHAVRRLDRRG